MNHLDWSTAPPFFIHFINFIKTPPRRVLIRNYIISFSIPFSPTVTFFPRIFNSNISIKTGRSSLYYYYLFHDRYFSTPSIRWCSIHTDGGGETTGGESESIGSRRAKRLVRRGHSKKPQSLSSKTALRSMAKMSSLRSGSLWPCLLYLLSTVVSFLTASSVLPSEATWVDNFQSFFFLNRCAVCYWERTDLGLVLILRMYTLERIA